MNGQGKDEAALDVVVLVEKDGKIISGSGGVMNSLKSELATGKLGYMTLGK